MAKKRQVLSQLDDLELIPGIEALPARAGPDTFESAASAPPELATLPPRDVELFRKGGWTFVKPAARGAAQPVFRDSDGHMKIDSGSLTVQFAPGLSQGEIETMLAKHGLKLGRKLGFAANLFTVRRQAEAGAGNSVEVAKDLAKSKDIEYAEPVLIEAVEKR
jgi:hypothetical protein